MGKRPCAPRLGQPERTLPPWHAGLGKGGPHKGGGHRRKAGWHRTQSLGRDRSRIPPNRRGVGHLARTPRRPPRSRTFGRQPSQPALAARARFCRAIPMVELGKLDGQCPIGGRFHAVDGRMGASRRECPQLVQRAWGLAWDVHLGKGSNPQHVRCPSHARRHAPRVAPVAIVGL